MHSCDEEFFVDELGLKKIPEGDWFCKACVKKNATKIGTAAKKTRGASKK